MFVLFYKTNAIRFVKRIAFAVYKWVWIDSIYHFKPLKMYSKDIFHNSFSGRLKLKTSYPKYTQLIIIFWF